MLTALRSNSDGGGVQISSVWLPALSTASHPESRVMGSQRSSRLHTLPLRLLYKLIVTKAGLGERPCSAGLGEENPAAASWQEHCWEAVLDTGGLAEGIEFGVQTLGWEYAKGHLAMAA